MRFAASAGMRRMDIVWRKKSEEREVKSEKLRRIRFNLNSAVEFLQTIDISYGDTEKLDDFKEKCAFRF